MLTLTAANTYTGATTITAGTLQIGNGGTTGTLSTNSAITVNGTLVLNRSDAITQGTDFAVGLTGTGNLTQAGSGTLTLSGSNAYSGGTILSQGTLRLDHVHAAGSGAITQTTNSSTLQINTTGTVAIAMSIFNIRTLQTVTLSGNKTLFNATYTVDPGTTTTESGNLTGGGGITKQGTGTLLVTGNNSFIGAVAVNAGVLELASTVGGAAATTTEVSVASGATLLISQSNQVNDTAAVSLSGGTIQRGSGVSEVFGNLNLTTGSFLDFGTGATGNLTFGTYQDNETPSALLTLNNFIPGNSFTFSSTSFTANNIGSYFTFGDGMVDYSVNNTGSTFTITAIPEPSTYLVAAGLLGLLILSARKRSAPSARS